MGWKASARKRWPCWRKTALIAAVWAATLIDASLARAEQRLALLIGNQTYTDAVGPLKNPHNDVALIKSALLRVGFAEKDIEVVRDADRITMLQAFDTFAAKVRRAGPDTISFFYYSGHGAANDRRENFLIPQDVSELTFTGFWYRSVALRELLDRLSTEAPEAKHFVVFDACRNTLKLRELGSRALVQPKGFVPVGNIPGGMLIAFATAEGELASDLGDSAGPYARALAEEIVKPAVEAVTVFRNVQIRVGRQTGQRPWTQNSPIGETYFAEREAPLPPPMSEAALAWQWVQNTESEAVLVDFINRHGTTVEGALARERLAELQGRSVTARIGVTACVAPWVWVRVTDVASRCMEPGSGQTFQNCWQERGENVCGPEMTILPKAGFQMGSSLAEIDALTGQYGDHFKIEAPQHEVKIPEPFAVSRFEVTFDDWTACVKSAGCKHNKTPSDRGWGKGKRPAINISWNDAQDYVDWLNSKVSDRPYRLLSEAEWEYAARAGTTSRYFWGDDVGNGNANCQGCGSQWDNKQTAPVGSFKPNRWGVYDMHGNVWEWVQDCYGDSYQETPADGRPAKTTENCPRIVRGGSSDFYPWGLRSAYRYRYVPDFQYDDVGFRVARTLTP